MHEQDALVQASRGIGLVIISGGIEWNECNVLHKVVFLEQFPTVQDYIFNF